ncbi:MAG: PHP domain-containing protein [Candidatus Aegiribacteria sp.]|nr:PHP domain-containing protein [Candidatus Aegiribacteria sp.]MBD3294619.1 PHP domain-containing protein [Candidatus Fermentibacteria bacterium]
MTGELMIKADLHTHSTCSDGELTPTELVLQANDLGFGIMSLTDHDITSGVREALARSDECEVEVIPGMEVTLRFTREYFTGSLHVLVYFSADQLFDDDFMQDLAFTVSKGRGPGLVSARVESINSHFGPHGENPVLQRNLTVEEIASLAQNISRRHFAKALSQNHDLSREQVTMLIGNQSPAYVPSGIELSRLKLFLDRHGVVPVLAHPAAGSFPGDSHYKEVLPPLETVERLLPEFLDAGIRGLEVYYPGHTEVHVKRLLRLASENDLVVTGGSDCHDRTERPMLKPGLVGDISAFLDLLKRTR